MVLFIFFKYVKRMSKLRYIFYIISVMQLYKCSLFRDYSNNKLFLKYHVTSTSLQNLYNAKQFQRDKKNVTCEIQFEENVVYKVCFQLKNIKLVNSNTNFFIYDENIAQDRTKFKEEYFSVVEGFLISKQNSSSITGYMKNFSFYGTVVADTITYSVEELRNYPEIYHKFRNFGYNAVVFKEESLNLSLFQNQFETESFLKNKIVNLSGNNDRELFKRMIGTGKVCSLFVLIDKAFLSLIHNGDLRAAVAHILSSLEEADTIFRSTDFDNDGYPDNIGFIIKYFVVILSENSPMNLLPKYSTSAIDGLVYLKAFSHYTILSEVCLGIAFTGNIFQNNVLGVSYTAQATTKNINILSKGGICDRPYKSSPEINFNALAVAPRLKNGRMVSQFLFDFCVAHEIGHSFGSFHDISSECKGHLMTEHTPEYNNRKSFTFSKCSKAIILKTIISKGHCFESYGSSFCGNGIVEEDEECDCGTIRDCESLDPCCISRGHKNSCRVNKKTGIDCHPSQGMCCNSKCKYNDLLNFGLDCRDFEKNCPCQKSEMCTCGVGGECTGNICSSQECTKVFLTECECPANVTQNKCRTCCLYNGSCVPSVIASEKVIEKNGLLIMSVKLFGGLNKRKDNKFGYYKKLCHKSLCAELYFWETKPGGFCVIHGKVGKCNKHLKCGIPDNLQIFPSLNVKASLSVPFYSPKIFDLFIIFVCVICHTFYY